MSGLPPNATIFLLGSGLSALCAWILLCRRPGWGMDPADEPRKMHAVARPRIGGLALFVAWIAAGLVCGQPAVLWVGGSLLFALGFCDDLVRVNSYRKLQVQGLAALLTYAMGLRLESLPTLSGAPFELPWFLSLPLTLFWLVGWTNAMNLIDGIDGLATGLVMTGMAFLTGILPEGGLLAWGVAGAAAGFFGFNFPRARMFLGDGGAYLSGYLFAAFSLTAGQGRGVPFLATVLCVPLLDTGYAFIRRIMRGHPVLRGDAEHIHHRLRALGMKGPAVTTALVGVTALSGWFAWRSVGSGGSGWPELLTVLGLGGSGIWWLAGRQSPGGVDQNNSARPTSSSVAGSETVSNSST
jgi:UDP-GlcNAc:undecaprenyl-phosphate GlcNAc-1-phosphate transferase